MPHRLVVIYGIYKIDGYTYYEYTFHCSDLDVLMGYYLPPSSYLDVWGRWLTQRVMYERSRALYRNYLSFLETYGDLRGLSLICMFFLHAMTCVWSWQGALLFNEAVTVSALSSPPRQHETVIPGDLPLIQEVTTTLREWSTIWRQLYVVRRWGFCGCFF